MKINRKTLTLMMLSLLPITLSAQNDLIILRNGNEIPSKVIQVAAKSITYKESAKAKRELHPAAVVSAKNAPSSNNTSNGNISYSNGGSSTYEQRNIQTSNGHSSSNSSSSKLCRTCKGDGKCIGCHESGYRTDSQFGTGVDYSHQCGVCRGSGKCSVCGGIGYK